MEKALPRLQSPLTNASLKNQSQVTPSLESQKLVFFYLPGSLWLGLLGMAAAALAIEMRVGRRRRRRRDRGRMSNNS